MSKQKEEGEEVKVSWLSLNRDETSETIINLNHH